MKKWKLAFYIYTSQTSFPRTVRLFEVSVFERKIFFSLKIYGKLAGLSNKFEPSMVFDPSEFEGLRFDLYICKMLISIFSWFFHTIFLREFLENCAIFVWVNFSFLDIKSLYINCIHANPLETKSGRGLALPPPPPENGFSEGRKMVHSI
jgi:hypothetical protein